MVDPVLAGLVGGFAGTVVMTIPMMMRDDPSPTDVLMSRVNGEPPETNQVAGSVLHFLYGSSAGLALAVLVGTFLDPVATFTMTEFALIGLAWGFVLWLGWFFWAGILGITSQMMDKPVGQRFGQLGIVFIFHLLYGAVAGAVTVQLV